MIRWAVVESKEAGETHVMPFKVMEGFDTMEEAEEFAKMVDEDICLTDEEGTVLGTYEGHSLYIDCVCDPDLRDDGLIVHHLFQ